MSSSTRSPITSSKRFWLSIVFPAAMAIACAKDAPLDPNAGLPPEQVDTDQDAIPDVGEDRNQNGTVDPGETNPGSTDTDADGIPDDQEVSYLACNKVSDRPFDVYDAPGTDSMILVDKAVSEHSTLRTVDNLAPALMVADPSLGVAAVMVSKRPGNTNGNPAAQRELERRTSLAGLGEVGPLQTRAFTTVEGFEAEQARFTLRTARPMDARSAAAQLASLMLGNVPLTGQLPAGGAMDNVFSVRLLTIIRSNARAVMVAAFSAGESPADAALIRLEELTDGTNVARHGSFTRHVCDQLAAKAQSKADIIFVVDDSGSMEDDQMAVRTAADAMEQVLASAQLDFRLGVTRHRASERMNANQRGSLEGDGLTADIEEFKRTIVVGAEGGWEPGLETGILAIDRLLPRTPENAAPAPNKLREGAATVIIHLSDERDQHIECSACGACDAQEGNQVFCNDPSSETVIDDFIAQYSARNAVNFAIVGDLPNGCQQTSTRDDFEPGQGYVEIANATGGQFGSLCGDMRQNLEGVARVVGGVASAYRLSQSPASASLKVAIGQPGRGRVIPRSRTNGFDYDPVQNSIIFYGDARPKDGDEVVIGYRRWDFANDPRTPPDGCDMCAGATSCDPTSDLVNCQPICGDDVCAAGSVCIPDTASCGDPNQVPPPPNEACGQCNPGLVCDAGAGQCVQPCEATGCNNNLVCNATTHVCEIPNF